MPSFNHEAFVAVAMQSVFNQSYHDLEFLIVDDCSTDSTFAIIQRMAGDRRFSGRFRRLTVNRNERNMGAHHSLNLGLAEARGDFVTFINSDDCYEPNRLRILTPLCPSKELPFLAFSAVRLVDAFGNRVWSHELKDVLEPGPERVRPILPSTSFGFLRHQLTGSTGNIFLNRALLSEIGDFVPLQYCHDWEFMLRAITVVEPCYVPQTAYRYRIHAGNTSKRVQHLAARETAATLSSYYRRVATGRVRNGMAPTPKNWPYVFDMFAQQFGVYDAWVQEDRCHAGYALRATGHDTGVQTERT